MERPPFLGDIYDSPHELVTYIIDLQYLHKFIFYPLILTKNTNFYPNLGKIVNFYLYFYYLAWKEYRIDPLPPFCQMYNS